MSGKCGLIILCSIILTFMAKIKHENYDGKYTKIINEPNKCFHST